MKIEREMGRWKEKEMQCSTLPLPEKQANIKVFHFKSHVCDFTFFHIMASTDSVSRVMSAECRGECRSVSERIYGYSYADNVSRKVSCRLSQQSAKWRRVIKIYCWK